MGGAVAVVCKVCFLAVAVAQAVALSLWMQGNAARSACAGHPRCSHLPLSTFDVMQLGLPWPYSWIILLCVWGFDFVSWAVKWMAGREGAAS